MRNALLLPALLAAAAAQAGPFLDPGRPPVAAQQAAQAESRARAASLAPTLDAEAMAHLRASFDVADVAHRGTLSREEARSGGFGWIADHFDAIDTRRAGRVSFDDVRRYLGTRGASAATK